MEYNFLPDDINDFAKVKFFFSERLIISLDWAYLIFPTHIFKINNLVNLKSNIYAVNKCGSKSAKKERHIVQYLGYRNFLLLIYTI